MYTPRFGVRVLGLLILLIGIWGGIVPFVGPLFHFKMGNTGAWTWTESRGTLHVAPAIAAVVGALLLLGGTRAAQSLGGLLSLVAGIWFVIGPSLEPLWTSSSGGGMHMMGGGMTGMQGTGSKTKQALEAIGYHYGTGAVIAALAAFALGLLLARAEAAPEAVRERERRRLSFRRPATQA
jgi:hypothetical protein